MLLDVKMTSARMLKKGIEYGRNMRGGRRPGLVLAVAALVVLYVIHGVRSTLRDSSSGGGGWFWRPTTSAGGSRHGSTTTTTAAADKGFSVKPIAYVFPQFHAIPENDEFWGANFTEWSNVKKVTKNAWGIEIQQPTDEIGYYNLLDYSTRARYARHARDAGLYGFVYHHYWFGRPVMERVLTKMLEDGQPDTPFMLSWANEP
jgi:hypothetical protein